MKTIRDQEAISTGHHNLLPITGERMAYMIEYMYSLEAFCKAGTWTHYSKRQKIELFEELKRVVRFVRQNLPMMEINFDPSHAGRQMKLKDEDDEIIS